ncbi:hypothetical protein F511_14740 [Dorcoceras hygrometricum]|uniref:TF-B3 domain-containing protein n=1 Tax=Dorcoceras hygrometricum TaxID=472368 RepID=A0A2Z7B014_9LAMI|nr:hypothetical protein F511_14740 [Dorcoceras hygrometricum]
MVRQMFRRGIVPCDECTKKCLTIHHHRDRKGPSFTERRFFKIVVGENWSEVLYLPPKFARDVRDLVGQETQIEDSNGEKWAVRLSYVDGALAFREGWHKFVEDHQLEFGENLVFNYKRHGHFVVQIYGLSACEIMDFNRGRKLSKKRSRSDQETVYQDEPHEIRNKRSALTSENMEDPSCILNRDSGKYEVEDRQFLFDLSNFEMGKNSSVAEKSETSLDRNITPVESHIREQIEVVRNDTRMSMPLTDQKNNHLCGISADAFQTAPRSDCNSGKDMPHDVSKFQVGKTENNCLHRIPLESLENNPFGDSDSRKDMTDAIKFRTSGTNNYQPCGMFSCAFPAKPSGNSNASKDTFDDISKFLACDSVKDMFNDVSKFLACETGVSTPFVVRGKLAATSKKEVVKEGEEVYGFTRVSSVDAGLVSTLEMKCGQSSFSCVKPEPVMDDVLAPAVATSPFSAEVKSLTFVELPLGMPSIQGKREQGRDKVVYLRSSTAGLWPVLYLGKSFVRAFTGGWKTFCKGNSIRAGYVCRFQVETYKPCVFRVDIIRKAGESSDR